MELYVLDENLLRFAVIDKYESLIWTERFADTGDFELVIASTIESRGLLTLGSRLAINESHRVMIIDTAESKQDAEGRYILTVKGPSLESVLKDRVAKKTFTNLTTEPTWTLVGTPGNIIREIFQTVCVTGALNVHDVIPFIASGSVYPPNTIPESADVISIDVDVTSVFAIIKSLCDTYDMGFHIVRDFDTSKLYFNVYTGSDRTTAQTQLPAVVFGSDLDNLTGIYELKSNAQYKNIAYVFAKFGTETVYAVGIDPNISGFERRVIFVDANDVDESDPVGLSTILQQRGLEALSKSKSIALFDGEIPESSRYTYGVDYQLGDLIEMRDSSDVMNYMRITEQIFASDAEGERSYPTLELKFFVTEGSWYDRDFNDVVWDDAIGFWDDL